jgi:DNA helicase IV
MDEKQKASLLQEAQSHVKQVRGTIDKLRPYILEQVNKWKSLIKTPLEVNDSSGITDKFAQLAMRDLNEHKYEAMEKLYPSPYFVRCDVHFEGTPAKQTVYFGKDSLTEEKIYSWITPASLLRFEDIGKFVYKLPDGRIQRGELFRKDQFMIIDGKIVFMTTESNKQERQLVYQEYLSQKKQGFILKDIVELMEKAQDQVIRAHHKGAFLISGPAGSGKTTLALHRVAYLVQSPETAQQYPGKEIMVFVQDSSTQRYFEGLLPKLGIHNVRITTFAEWAFEVLGLKGFTYVTRFGATEKQKDLYEFAKNKVLDCIDETHFVDGSIENLMSIYESEFDDTFDEVLERQIGEKKLDRFDLTILLKAHFLKHGHITTTKKIFTDKKYKGKYKVIFERQKTEYALIIVDEVQNYIPDQITIFRSCMKERNKAILYVGDLAQQTHLCTLRDWNAVNEIFEENRKVELQKVYRNTKQILEYISSVGYKVVVPEGIREGKPVFEQQVKSVMEELAAIQEIVKSNPNLTIGILGKTPEYMTEFKKEFTGNERVHVLTINESQGVEFDIVCLVGISKNAFLVREDDPEYPAELVAEKKRVNKDLLYVGLTRAIDEVYIYCTDPVKEIVESFRK